MVGRGETMYEPTIQNISNNKWKLGTWVRGFENEKFAVEVRKDGTIGYQVFFGEEYELVIISWDEICLYRSYLQIYQDENLALLTFILNYLNGELLCSNHTQL